MAIQYADYGADNNDVSFAKLKVTLQENRLQAMLFGLPVYLLLTIPGINLVVMPAGVAGGTRFWVEHLKRWLIESFFEAFKSVETNRRIER